MHRPAAIAASALCACLSLGPSSAGAQAPAAPIAQPAAKGGVRFEFSRLHSDRGRVACALYGSADDFLKKSLLLTTATIAGGRAVCVFADLPPGTYALAAYHDENGNDKLDTNFLGIPKEGVCASNNAKGTMGPPRWKGAAFAYSGAPVSQQLQMRY